MTGDAILPNKSLSYLETHRFALLLFLDLNLSLGAQNLAESVANCRKSPVAFIFPTPSRSRTYVNFGVFQKLRKTYHFSFAAQNLDDRHFS